MEGAQGRASLHAPPPPPPLCRPSMQGRGCEPHPPFRPASSPSSRRKLRQTGGDGGAGGSGEHALRAGHAAAAAVVELPLPRCDASSRLPSPMLTQNPLSHSHHAGGAGGSAVGRLAPSPGWLWGRGQVDALQPHGASWLWRDVLQPQPCAATLPAGPGATGGAGGDAGSGGAGGERCRACTSAAGCCAAAALAVTCGPATHPSPPPPYPQVMRGAPAPRAATVARAEMAAWAVRCWAAGLHTTPLRLPHPPPP